MDPLTLSRRQWLKGSALAIGCAAGLEPAGAAGDAHSWLSYDLSEVKILLPTSPAARAAMVGEFLQPQVHPMPGMRRIEPKVSASAPPSPSSRAPRYVTRGDLPARMLREPPTAYVLTAQRAGVPAWLLFGVALQESQLAFGKATVPFPWTLCVRGRGERHNSYQAVRDALQGYLRAGVTNVDCGAMQVNWHWHSDKLQSVDRALDPYPNLAVGASILLGHYRDTGDWRTAVGLYHTGSADSGDKRDRAASYRAGVARRLAASGVSMESVIAAHARNARMASGGGGSAHA